MSLEAGPRELSLSQSGIWNLKHLAYSQDAAPDQSTMEKIEELRQLPECWQIEKCDVQTKLSGRIHGTYLLRATKTPNIFELNFVQENDGIGRLSLTVGERGIIHCGPNSSKSISDFFRDTLCTVPLNRTKNVISIQDQIKCSVGLSFPKLWNKLFSTNAFVPNLDQDNAEKMLNKLSENNILCFLFRLVPTDENAFILSYATMDGVQHIRFVYNPLHDCIENPATYKNDSFSKETEMSLDLSEEYTYYHAFEDLIRDYTKGALLPIHCSESVLTKHLLAVVKQHPAFTSIICNDSLKQSKEGSFMISPALQKGVYQLSYLGKNEIVKYQYFIIAKGAVLCEGKRFDTIEELIKYFSLNTPMLKVKIDGLNVEDTAKEYKRINLLPKEFFKVLTKESENQTGNRYPDVLPFNENRIKLANGSYINASKVTTSNGGTYICAQGPMKDTLDQFWQMVWQENVPVIIMVTDLIEKEREKCAQYWPEYGTRRCRYDEVYVECTAEQFRYAESASELGEGLTLRTFKLTKEDQIKYIHQLKYEKWPDMGIADPELISRMIDDANKLRSSLNAINKPLLVHCSAGIGRTGTFIAEHHLSSLIDAALSKGESTTINVRETVVKLRNVQTGRINMVQNEGQYAHIYQVLQKRYQGNY